MKKYRTRTAGAISALAALTLAAGCGNTESSATAKGGKGQTVSITDAQGREVEVPTNPQKVVALDWSVIRTLSDLDIDVDAVPTPQPGLPKDLASYQDATHVGTIFEPDYEAIAAMEPDLVIVGSRSGNPEIVKEFEKFAPAVLDMSVRAEKPSEVFDATEERVVQLGTIFGKKEQAEGLMDDLDTQVDAVSDQAEASDRTAMVVQVSDGTVSAYGPGSRFGTVYEDFGYRPTKAPLQEKGSHGEEISQEFFVQYNPGVLFVLDRAKTIGQDQTPALDVLNKGLIKDTDAAKDNKIVEVDGFAWYIAPSAPSSWTQMVSDVKDTL